MSDDAPAFWNAFVAVFGVDFTSSVRKLLCAWHVLRSWQRNKNKFSPTGEHPLNPAAIHYSLVLLMRQPTRELFEQKLSILEQILAPHPEFWDYFSSTYLKDDVRIFSWAYFAREGTYVRM